MVVVRRGDWLLAADSARVSSTRATRVFLFLLHMSVLWPALSGAKQVPANPLIEADYPAIKRHEVSPVAPSEWQADSATQLQPIAASASSLSWGKSRVHGGGGTLRGDCLGREWPQALRRGVARAQGDVLVAVAGRAETARSRVVVTRRGRTSGPLVPTLKAVLRRRAEHGVPRRGGRRAR